MDNVTHALAGMLLADATVQVAARTRPSAREPRFRRAAVVLGIVAAELPDSDLLYSGPLVQLGPLGYLLHHRGHTHTLVWASIGALLLWLVARWWLRRGPKALPASVVVAPRPEADPSWPLLALAFAGTWSHLLLDWTNSYGVHPFWPFDDRWFYGDLVFIVEPWLWMAAIPPLLWGTRSHAGRVILALLGAGMVIAAWSTGQVGPWVAAALTVALLLWFAGQAVVQREAHAWVGLAAWALVTVGFAGGERIARKAAVKAAATGGDRVLDAVLNPAPGDPLCWSVLVVSRSADGGTYRLTSGLVGLVTGRSAQACAERYARGRAGADVLAELTQATAAPASGTDDVQWRRRWEAPVDSLRALAAQHCEVAAALRFMRTPAWERDPDGTVHLGDARYGARRGFAAVTIPPTTACSIEGGWVPPWTPPRAELLGEIAAP